MNGLCGNHMVQTLHRHEAPERQLSLVKLESAQRVAMKAILGTFRTTPTSTLQSETTLMPTHLRLRYRVLQSWTRMQTAPQTHPINAAIQRAKSYQSYACTTLHEHLTRTFPKYNGTVETVKPFPFPPWWSPPFMTRIETNKRTAKSVHDQTTHDQTTHDQTTHDQGTLYIYTDAKDMWEQLRSALKSHKYHSSTWEQMQITTCTLQR